MTKEKIANHLIQEIQDYRDNPQWWNDDLDFKSIDSALMVAQNIIKGWSIKKASYKEQNNE